MSTGGRLIIYQASGNDAHGVGVMTEWIHQSGKGWSLARLSEASRGASFTLREEVDHHVTNDTFATEKIKGWVRVSAASPLVDFLSISNELQREICVLWG